MIEGILTPTEKYEAIVRKAIDAMNKQDLTIIDEVFAKNYIDHTNGFNSREMIKQFYTAAFTDFPDFHRTIEDMVVKGNKVWARFNITATVKGQKIEMPAITIMRIVKGRITEAWGGPIQRQAIPKAKGELIQKIQR